MLQQLHTNEPSSLLPLRPTTQEEHRSSSIVGVAAYCSRTSVRGYGNVQGFELLYSSGGRMQFGSAKGKRELMRLTPGETIQRVAGRVDRARGRNSVEPNSDAESVFATAGCLVSLQFFTDTGREVIFGLSTRLRAPGYFSYSVSAGYELVGVQVASESEPVITAIEQRLLASAPLWMVQPIHLSSSPTPANYTAVHSQAPQPAAHTADDPASMGEVGSFDTAALSAATPATESEPPPAPKLGEVETPDLDGASKGGSAGPCVVCLDREQTHALVPCGHRCVCASCISAVWSNGRVCPVCRTMCARVEPAQPAHTTLTERFPSCAQVCRGLARVHVTRQLVVQYGAGRAARGFTREA